MNSLACNDIKAENRQIAIAFDRGFLNASNSLGQLVNDKIQYDLLQRGHYDFQNGDVPNGGYERHNQSSKHLITTEIVGEVTGKSYLFLSDEEFNQLTIGIPSGSSVDYKEEFLKELDNIISAAVITVLANTLEKKMYGGVPVFVGKTNSNVEDAIFDDFNDSTKLYVNSITFSFKSNPAITPLFIWVMNEE